MAGGEPYAERLISGTRGPADVVTRVPIRMPRGSSREDTGTIWFIDPQVGWTNHGISSPSAAFVMTMNTDIAYASRDQTRMDL